VRTPIAETEGQRTRPPRRGEEAPPFAPEEGAEGRSPRADIVRGARRLTRAGRATPSLAVASGGAGASPRVQASPERWTTCGYRRGSPRRRSKQRAEAGQGDLISRPTSSRRYRCQGQPTAPHQTRGLEPLIETRPQVDGTQGKAARTGRSRWRPAGRDAGRARPRTVLSTEVDLPKCSTAHLQGRPRERRGRVGHWAGDQSARRTERVPRRLSAGGENEPEAASYDGGLRTGGRRRPRPDRRNRLLYEPLNLGTYGASHGEARCCASPHALQTRFHKPHWACRGRTGRASAGRPWSRQRVWARKHAPRVISRRVARYHPFHCSSALWGWRAPSCTGDRGTSRRWSASSPDGQETANPPRTSTTRVPQNGGREASRCAKAKRNLPGGGPSAASQKHRRMFRELASDWVLDRHSQ